MEVSFILPHPPEDKKTVEVTYLRQETRAVALVLDGNELCTLLSEEGNTNIKGVSRKGTQYNNSRHTRGKLEVNAVTAHRYTSARGEVYIGGSQGACTVL